MKPFVCLLGLLWLTACRPDASLGPLEGTYGGTFQRGIYDPAQVTITFTSGRFSGTVAPASNLLVLSPIIGSGPFSVSGRTITFTDETIYPAKVDQTTVLNGAFPAEIRNGQLILKRDKDTYILEKK